MRRLLDLSVVSLLLLTTACGPSSPPAGNISSEGDELEWACASLDAAEDRRRCEGENRRRRPPPALVDQVERQLANHPCVGQLARWQRLYSFGIAARHGSEAGEADEGTVAFMLRQAGVHGFRSERRITPALVWVNIDDRIYDFVSGSYDVATRTLRVDHCGPNVAVPAR